MMDGLIRVWETVWQMSLTGGFVCLIVCLLRLLMKKAPKSYAYALWAVVFLRFVCPVGLNGSFSVIPRWEQIGDRLQSMVQEVREEKTDPQDALDVGGNGQAPSMGQNENEHSGNTQTGMAPSQGQAGMIPSGTLQPGTMQPGVSQSNTSQPGMSQPGMSQLASSQPGTLNSELSQSSGEDLPGQPSGVTPSQGTAVIPDQSSEVADGEQEKRMTVADGIVMVWLLGICGIAAVQILRTYRWKRSLGIVGRGKNQTLEVGMMSGSHSNNIHGDNIHEISGLATPFVMGFFDPQIYLPTGMSQEQRQYVLHHEQTHIRRKDHLVKGLAFAVTCVHWFNPMAWLAYYLICMDMEMSCDESVIAQMEHGRKEYAQALLNFAEQSVGGGLAFGEPYAMKRIRNILEYRRPAFEVSVILTILCLVVSGCLMTDPKQTEGPETGEDGEIIVIDREEETEEDSRNNEETTGSQTLKPADRLNPNKNQEKEDQDEGPLPVLDEELLTRLNSYPQADQAILDYFDRLFKDPYYLAFTAESYTDITKDILWNVAAALADQLGPESEISDGEIQRLKDAGMDMNLDLIWVSTEDIMKAWEQCSETKLTMAQIRDDMTGWYYLSDLDRWYMQTGGVMVEPIECVNVWKWGTLTHVIYQCEYSDVWGEILLRGNEAGGYKVVAHQRRYSDHFEELYAPEDFYATAVRNMEDSWGSWYGGILNVYRDVWFEDYEGGTLEVLDGYYETYEDQSGLGINYGYESPMYCDDIVYYRPDGDETIDQIAATMMEAMVDRMTVPSDIRPFTITQYRITEKQVNSMEITLQELWQGYRMQTILHGELETWQDYLKWAVTSDGRAPIGEDIWYFIPRGDYAFDGVGLLGMTMEDEIQLWPEGYQDGMIPFQAQGGDGVFLFILMKQGYIYRLQRANGMRRTIGKIGAHQSEEPISTQGDQALMDSLTVYFSDWRHRAFLQRPLLRYLDYVAPKVMETYAMHQYLDPSQYLNGQEVWDSLTKEQQRQLKDAGIVEDSVTELVTVNNQEFLDAWKKSWGQEITTADLLKASGMDGWYYMAEMDCWYGTETAYGIRQYDRCECIYAEQYEGELYAYFRMVGTGAAYEKMVLRENEDGSYQIQSYDTYDSSSEIQQAIKEDAKRRGMN